MLDHHHAVATMEDIVAKTRGKLEQEGVNIFYTGVAVWDSNARVTALLTVARCLVCVHLTRLLPAFLQGVLVILFGPPRLLLKV